MSLRAFLIAGLLAASYVAAVPVADYSGAPPPASKTHPEWSGKPTETGAAPTYPGKPSGGGMPTHGGKPHHSGKPGESGKPHPGKPSGGGGGKPSGGWPSESKPIVTPTPPAYSITLPVVVTKTY